MATGGASTICIERFNCIYPAYLNSNKSVSKGRRIPKELAVPDPNIMEIAEVLKQLNVQAVLEPNKVYSRECKFEDPTFRGRVRLQISDLKPQLKNKQHLLVFIADGISKLNRKRFQQPSTSSSFAVDATAGAEPSSSASGSGGQGGKKSGRRNNRKK